MHRVTWWIIYELCQLVWWQFTDFVVFLLCRCSVLVTTVPRNRSSSPRDEGGLIIFRIIWLALEQFYVFSYHFSFISSHLQRVSYARVITSPHMHLMTQSIPYQIRITPIIQHNCLRASMPRPRDILQIQKRPVHDKYTTCGTFVY